MRWLMAVRWAVAARFAGLVFPMAADEVELEVGNRSVRISNPGRVYFPGRGEETKLDLVRYYLSVGDGIVRALRERPCMMHRFPSGVAGEKVHQKRVPHGAPPWLETVRVDFPRYGRHADELCVTELASVVWAVQMSTVEFHPWNSRRADVERPDEWRIDDADETGVALSGVTVGFQLVLQGQLETSAASLRSRWSAAARSWRRHRS